MLFDSPFNLSAGTDMLPLILPSSLADQLRRESAAAYPEECCGILIGRDTGTTRLIEQAIGAPNTHPPDQRHNRFTLDPATQLAAERQAAEQGRAVIGFYHSHPDHPASPSETDRLAAWPFYSYLIVSVRHGVAAEINSWVLDEATASFLPQAVHSQ